ncbi:MAG: hypothetical protein FWF84_04885, partial [Kiritimatiellaeota bacterium]|nr:hypothetical protein [Kiritimatiellota bacterium]
DPSLTAAQQKAADEHWDWWSARSHAAPDNFVFSLYGDKFKPTAITANTGRSSRGFTDSSVNTYTMEFEKAGDGYRNFTLFPFGGNGNYDQYRWSAFGDGDNFLAILPSSLGSWRQPDIFPRSTAILVQHNDTAELRLYTSNKGGKHDMYVVGTLSLGKREWAILAAKGVAIDRKDIEKTVTKYTNYWLDKVKEWVLEWDDAAATYPNIFVKPRDGKTALEVFRGNIQASAWLVEHLNTNHGYWHTSRELYREYMLGDDSQEIFDKAYETTVNRIDSVFFTTFARLLRPSCDPHVTPWHSQIMATEADLVLGSPRITAEQKQALLSRVAFLAYLLRDPVVRASRSTSTAMGSSNMPVNMNGGRYFSAALLTTHPLYGEWMDYSKEYFTALINDTHAGAMGEDGSPMSCPHYNGATQGPLIGVIVSLQNKGMFGNDIGKAFPNLYNYMHWLVDEMTPVDPRAPYGVPQRGEPPIGHCEPSEHNGLAVLFAPLVKESDPELAANLVWAWETSGQAMSGGFVSSAMFIDGTIPSKVPAMKSVVYPGFAAFLRAGEYDAPTESYLSLRFGDYTFDHMQPDAGSWHWYEQAKPISVDWGSMYTPEIGPSQFHNTLSFNHEYGGQPCPNDDTCFYRQSTLYKTSGEIYPHEVEPKVTWTYTSDPVNDTNVAAKNGTTTAYSFGTAADYVRGEAHREHFSLQPYTEVPDQNPSAWRPFENFPIVQLKTPVHWTRQYMYVKGEAFGVGNYLVVKDDLRDKDGANPELNPAFNFWYLGDTVTQEGDTFRFTDGQYGIDLTMVVLDRAGKDTRIERVRYGHNHRNMNEYQECVRVHGGTGETSFHVTLIPATAGTPTSVTSEANGAVTKIAFPDRTDYVFMSVTPTTVTVDGIAFTGTAAMVKVSSDGTVTRACEVE